MGKKLTPLLESIGLMPSESKVYLAALELGPSPVQAIAQKSGISRTAAYDAISQLSERGLMSSSIVGKKQLYAAEDPERIVSYLKEEQQKFKTKIEDVTRSIDALKLLGGGAKPIVKVYEGKEALTAYFDYIEKIKPREFDEISNVDDVYDYLDEGVLLSARSAYKHTPKNARILLQGTARNPRKGYQYRTLPEDLEFRGNITIFDKYIFFISYIGTMTVIVMESEMFANSMRALFETMWRSGKKPKLIFKK
ncbi:TrmB family transcriptional regulator [Candidatus Uhrbacteria bacterium]|jgi:HTH-type transcriptional regulator, sugar sensing transcriptional regulator|nr:TrmB family transcriptional regulator [Candidatus Uhrbacteria bacterium]MBT7717132.1 TrmB family transcriptional regulator [Candidatus Uhrbacteria bacterium]